MDNCIFCTIVAGKAPASMVYEPMVLVDKLN